MSKNKFKGWNSSTEVVKNEDLYNEIDKDLSWLQGYFWVSFEGEGSELQRNLHELRQRDFMMFELGDVEDKKILDVGCGAGEYLRTTAKMGASYLGGQDLDEVAVNRGRLAFENEGINGKLVVGDCQKLDFPDNYFDIAFSSDFFEHISLDVKENVVAEVCRVLKPGGTFIIKTPNLTYLRIVINIKRILNILRFRSPFIYIPHTNENPDTEHYGLTTHAELTRVLENNFFHTPETTYTPIIRKRLPMFITNILMGKKPFSESIIIKSKKSIFYSMWS